MREYEELHQIIDRLTPGQFQELYDHALRLAQSRTVPEPDADRTPLFAGVIDDAPSDLAERIEEHVSERFNNSL